jgi:DUF971 family protein
LLPREVAALEAIPEFRKWQIAELGAGFVKALGPWAEVRSRRTGRKKVEGGRLKVRTAMRGNPASPFLLSSFILQPSA